MALAWLEEVETRRGHPLPRIGCELCTTFVRLFMDENGDRDLDSVVL